MCADRLEQGRAAIRVRSDAGQNTLGVSIDVAHHVDLVAFFAVVGLVYADGFAPDVVSVTVPGRLLESILAVPPDPHPPVVDEDGRCVVWAAPDIRDRMVRGHTLVARSVEEDVRFLPGVESPRCESTVDFNAFKSHGIIDREDLEQPDVAAWVSQRVVTEKGDIARCTHPQ